MTLAVFYTFAVAGDVPPVVGAAGHDVLARQLPHLAVHAMNGGVDRGLRYFPLLGAGDDGPEFFAIREVLDVGQLQSLHGVDGPVPFVVDGRIDAESLLFRVHDAGQRCVAEHTIPFDPLRPLPALRRMVFEASEVFGWHGPLPEIRDLDPYPLSYYLVARDDLLSLEARCTREHDEQWTRAAATALAVAPDHPDVEAVALDVCRLLVKRRMALPQVRATLLPAVADTAGDAAAGDAAVGDAAVGDAAVGDAAVGDAAVGDAAPDRAAADRAARLAFVGEVAAVLDDAGCAADAAGLFERLLRARDAPVLSEAAVVRLAGYLFHGGRFAEGRDQLERVVARGVRSARVLSQLAVLYRNLGQEVERRGVIDELAARVALPPSAARMVSCDLVDRGDVDAAHAVIARCVQRFPEHPAVWLEMGRVLLHRGDPRPAGPALDRVLGLDPAPAVREEARRLRRFVELPDVLPALRGVDAALAAQQFERAERGAVELVAAHPDLAEGWLFLAITRQRAARPAAAIEALRRAVALDPLLGEAHNRLGILLVGDGRHGEGYERLRDAIACMPEDWGPRVHLAQACFFLGDRDAARAALADAERLGADPTVLASVRLRFLRDDGGATAARDRR